MTRIWQVRTIEPYRMICAADLIGYRMCCSRSSWCVNYPKIPRLSVVMMFLVAAMLVMDHIMVVKSAPFPAPELGRCDNTSEGCCTPVVEGEEPILFQFPTNLRMRIRRPAQLLDERYIAKYQKAYELMRALPHTDGRSFLNQAKVHCAYCDNHLFYPGHEYPLEIHNNWLFLPWHRLFLYFHERILAKLLGDDEFALPYWNWDNQSQESPQGNMVPKVYADQTGFGDSGNTSFLYDSHRNPCSARPKLVVLNDAFIFCPNETDEFRRTENARAMYTQLVTAPVTPTLLFGQPYRFGDQGGRGAGSLEVKPHGPVHVWVNIEDMLDFKNSATDPIFYAHHANVDRMWVKWKKLKGGIRTDLPDPNWLNTKFTFYDENGKLVTVTIAQSLDPTLLRYKYQKMPTPWVNHGKVELTDTHSPWSLCNLNASTKSAMTSMIKASKPFSGPYNFSGDALTFHLKRPGHGAHNKSSAAGEEVLQVTGNLNWTQNAAFQVFLFIPTAVHDVTSIGCPEFLGLFQSTPHVGMSNSIPSAFVWQVGVLQKLKDMGRESLSHLVVTLVGPPVSSTNQPLLITSAKVLYTHK